VKALEEGTALKAVYGDAVISVGALYESAMDQAFWQRYRRDDADAAATVKEIDEALAKAPALSAEDKLRIDAVRRQYAMLGEPLPPFKTTPIAVPPKTKAKAAAVVPAAPDLKIGPDYGAATVLVLFPDWCPQCRKMMTALTEFGAANKDTPIYVRGLMFLDDPAPLGPATNAMAVHEQNIKEVQGTSTLLVDGKIARDLGVLDFPLGIVLDHDGQVRYIGVLPGDAFNGNGYMEKILTRMTGTPAAASPAR
jgi:thiol-disulfide isomerase/thioredoxin